MVLGKYRTYFWGSLLIGVAVPVAIIMFDAWQYMSLTTTIMNSELPNTVVHVFSRLDAELAASAAIALAGLALYEHAYVQAGQSVPQS